MIEHDTSPSLPCLAVLLAAPRKIVRDVEFRWKGDTFLGRRRRRDTTPVTLAFSAFYGMLETSRSSSFFFTINATKLHARDVQLYISLIDDRSPLA